MDIVQSRSDMFSISVQATNLSIVFKNELKKRDATKLTCNNSRPNQKDSVELPPLELPWNQNIWVVHVSWVISTADFWVQLIESELMVRVCFSNGISDVKRNFEWRKISGTLPGNI